MVACLAVGGPGRSGQACSVFGCKASKRQLLAVSACGRVAESASRPVHVWQAGSAGAVGCTLSKHQLVVGSVDDQLLAACWRGDQLLAAQRMFSELPGGKKGSKLR